MRKFIFIVSVLLISCSGPTKTELPAPDKYPLNIGQWIIPSPVYGKWGGTGSNNKSFIGDTIIVNDTTDYKVTVSHDSTSTADLADRTFNFSITDSTLNGLEYDYFLPNEVVLTLPNVIIEEIQDNYIISSSSNEINTSPNHVEWVYVLTIRKCLDETPSVDQIMYLTLQKDDSTGHFRTYQIDITGFIETVNYILCEA